MLWTLVQILTFQTIENLDHGNHRDLASINNYCLQCLRRLHCTQIKILKIIDTGWEGKGWFCNVHANSGEDSELEYNFGKIARFSHSWGFWQWYPAMQSGMVVMDMIWGAEVDSTGEDHFGVGHATVPQPNLPPFATSAMSKYLRQSILNPRLYTSMETLKSASICRPRSLNHLQLNLRCDI